MKEKIYVIHDTDTDGKIAAALLVNNLTDVNEAVIIGVGHGNSFKNLDFKSLEIPENSVIYVLDHEMTKAIVAKIFRQCNPKHLHVIDHHPGTGTLYSLLDEYDGRFSFMHGEKNASTSFLIYNTIATGAKYLYRNSAALLHSVNMYDCWLFDKPSYESIYAVATKDDVSTYSITVHLEKEDSGKNETLGHFAKALNSAIFSKELYFGTKQEGSVLDIMMFFINADAGFKHLETRTIGGYDQHTYVEAKDYFGSRPYQPLSDEFALTAFMNKKTSNVALEERKADQIAESNVLVCTKTIAGKIRRFALVFSSDMPNEIASSILKKHKDVNFVIVIYLKPGDRMYKFSLRSEEGRQNVEDIARYYGGGGHRNASGFQLDAKGFLEFMGDLNYVTKGG